MDGTFYRLLKVDLFQTGIDDPADFASGRTVSPSFSTNSRGMASFCKLVQAGSDNF